MSYKTLIYTDIRVSRYRCLNTDTLLTISAQRGNYSNFHKNCVRYNINATNEAKSK